MMIDSKIYKGIEYVQVSELPQLQREKLTQTLNQDLFIKIMIDGKIVSDCLQFKDYSFWYHSVYQPKAIAGEKVEIEEVTFGANQLAFK
jgi:hypothetical protein